VRELVIDGAQRSELQAVGCGCERDVRLVEFAHHLGHGQALAIELAQAGAAELAAVAFFQ
jgi:predicted TIM-barrel enzyme